MKNRPTIAILQRLEKRCWADANNASLVYQWRIAAARVSGNLSMKAELLAPLLLVALLLAAPAAAQTDRWPHRPKCQQRPRVRHLFIAGKVRTVYAVPVIKTLGEGRDYDLYQTHKLDPK